MKRIPRTAALTFISLRLCYLETFATSTRKRTLARLGGVDGRAGHGSRESEAGLGPSAMAGEQRRAGRLRGAEARTSLAAFLLGGSVVAAVPLLLRAGFQGRSALALHVAGANATLLFAWGRAPGGMYQVRGGAPPWLAVVPGGGAYWLFFFSPEHAQKVLPTPRFAIRPKGGIGSETGVC